MSTPTAEVRDAVAATEFVQLLVGYKVIGCSGGESVVVPCSRELRAHLVAALGELCPTAAVGITRDEALALADYLRSVADRLDGVT